MSPAILFVIGASGAGKTAAVHALEQQQLSGVGCYHFDSIGVPSAQVMEQEWGGGERWQEQTTTRWIERLAANADGVEIAVLEGQTRPSFVQAAIERLGVRGSRIVLVDCQPAVRGARLAGPRAQPALNDIEKSSDTFSVLALGLFAGDEHFTPRGRRFRLWSIAMLGSAILFVVLVYLVTSIK